MSQFKYEKRNKGEHFNILLVKRFRLKHTGKQPECQWPTPLEESSPYSRTLLIVKRNEILRKERWFSKGEEERFALSTCSSPFTGFKATFLFQPPIWGAGENK